MNAFGAAATARSPRARERRLKRSLLGAPRRDPKPVAVRVHQIALPPGKSFLVDGDLELLGHCIDVSHIEVDERVRAGVALVLREIEPDRPAGHGNEPGEARLELVLPLFDEPEASVPGNSPVRVRDVQNRHDLLVHVSTLEELSPAPVLRNDAWRFLRSRGNLAKVGDDPCELLRAHVQRFNDAVRSGNFSEMVAGFTPEAVMAFEGVPVGPFVGREAISDAYAGRPPDDEVRLLGLPRVEMDVVESDYAWARDGRRAGRMILTATGGLIARLVVTFE